MELSTNIPIPSANPDSEIIFNVTPLKYIHTKAVIKLIGIEQAIIKVGFKLLKKNSNTKIARIAP